MTRKVARGLRRGRKVSGSENNDQQKDEDEGKEYKWRILTFWFEMLCSLGHKGDCELAGNVDRYAFANCCFVSVLRRKATERDGTQIGAVSRALRCTAPLGA